VNGRFGNENRQPSWKSPRDDHVDIGETKLATTDSTPVLGVATADRLAAHYLAVMRIAGSRAPAGPVLRI
jgi:hypothetical protein